MDAWHVYKASPHSFWDMLRKNTAIPLARAPAVPAYANQRGCLPPILPLGFGRPPPRPLVSRNGSPRIHLHIWYATTIPGQTRAIGTSPNRKSITHKMRNIFDLSPIPTPQPRNRTMTLTTYTARILSTIFHPEIRARPPAPNREEDILESNYSITSLACSCVTQRQLHCSLSIVDTL